VKVSPATPWLYLAIPLLGLLTVFVYPLGHALWMSLQDYQNSLTHPAWVGLGNFQHLFRTPGFWQAVQVTVLFSVVTIPAMVILPLGLATWLNQPIRGLALIRVLLYLPVIVPIVMVAMAWRPFYARDGALNQLLSGLHLPAVNRLSDPAWALWATVLLIVWKGLAYYAMMYLTHLQTWDSEQTEAALLDGASTWQRAWYVMLPALRPAMLLVGTISLLGCFKAFPEFYVLTRGGPLGSTTTWIYWVYQAAFERLDLGTACAAGLVLMLALIGLSSMTWRLERHMES
jgi:putative chitobiose transport system permease protein